MRKGGIAFVLSMTAVIEVARLPSFDRVNL